MSKIGLGGLQRSRFATERPAGPPTNESVNSEIGMSGRPSKVTWLRRSGVRAMSPCSFSASAPRRSSPSFGSTPPSVDATTYTSPVSGVDCSGEAARAVPTLVFAGQFPAVERQPRGTGTRAPPGCRPRSPGRVTWARFRPASSMVCEIVVETSTASVIGGFWKTEALNSGENGSDSQPTVSKASLAESVEAS